MHKATGGIQALSNSFLLGINVNVLLWGLQTFPHLGRTDCSIWNGGSGIERLISDNVEQDKRHRTRWGSLCKPGCRLESETITVSGRVWGDENDSGVDYTVRYYNLSGFMMSVMAGIHLFRLLYSTSLCQPNVSKVPICHSVHNSLVVSFKSI